MSESTWYDRKRDDVIIGYGMRRGYLRIHLTSQKVGGPGAVVITALCHGIQPIFMSAESWPFRAGRSAW